MTPAARYAAAIEVLDDVIGGAPAEQSLTQWARGHRFAGSGDRAAIRDHVYDVLRARRSLAVRGGGQNARALILGLLRRDGPEPGAIFGAGGHAPSALTPAETVPVQTHMTDAEQADLPDWLWPVWQEDLGAQAMSVAEAQRRRAAVFLRVNLSRSSRAAAQTRLLADGIPTRPHPLVETGLQVLDNSRRVATSAAYLEGLVEVQDAASQMAVARMPLQPGWRVLDYCAGGGGKALAIADRSCGPVWTHDIDPNRTKDIAPRAARAGARIETLATTAVSDHAPFDVVFVDAPCSGSGTWRRTPDAKWRLTSDRLRELNVLQAEILASAATLTAPGGLLVYATCSVLTCENDGIVMAVLGRGPRWQRIDHMTLLPTDDHDGFQMAVLRKL